MQSYILTSTLGLQTGNLTFYALDSHRNFCISGTSPPLRQEESGPDQKKWTRSVEEEVNMMGMTWEKMKKIVLLCPVAPPRARKERVNISMIRLQVLDNQQS